MKKIVNMKTIKFTDPDTFDESEQSFEDFHYELAEKIKEFLKDNFKHTTQIISNKEADKLSIGIMKDRQPGDAVEKYKITIEKIIG